MKTTVIRGRRAVWTVLLCAACALGQGEDENGSPGVGEGAPGTGSGAGPSGVGPDGSLSDQFGENPQVDARPAPPIIDAPPPPDAPPPVDAAPSVVCQMAESSTPGGDPCAQALDLDPLFESDAGTSVTLYGSTASFANDLEPPSMCTSNYTQRGPDAVYRVTVPAGKTLKATLRPDGWDGSLYILSACDNAACVSGRDSADSAGAENVSHMPATPGPYYVVVDGWQPSAKGCYTLEVALE